MSLLSRILAPPSDPELVALVERILRAPAPPAPLPRIPGGPTGLGTSAARFVVPVPEGEPDRAGVPPLYCPPPVRDDPALGESVNERLVEWAGEIGIYPGNLDRVRACNFGRLIMLTHPDCDDPDRLLAAARCALAEWSVDDHYVDGDGPEADPHRLGRTLAIAYTAIDPAHLPPRYQAELAEVAEQDPVMRALESAIGDLGRYAASTQVARLRHELAVMFVAYNQEGVWRAEGIRPPVWEYLQHRHENSFLPCMVLIDAIGGYEVPPVEFTDPAVRRAFSLAGTASVIVNDLYSMGAEDPSDTNLPRLLAEQDGCSLDEAIRRTAAIHDDLVRTFQTEAAALTLTGSPALGRFLAGLWAWLGGGREWHATTGRYHTTS